LVFVLFLFLFLLLCFFVFFFCFVYLKCTCTLGQLDRILDFFFWASNVHCSIPRFMLYMYDGVHNFILLVW
jgi:hypothetical protein